MYLCSEDDDRGGEGGQEEEAVVAQQPVPQQQHLHHPQPETDKVARGSEDGAKLIRGRPGRVCA